jgi:hypothetical protein
MLLHILTFAHVAISLAGLVSGFVVLFGLLTARTFDRWTTLFLATTVATSVTGFFFPVSRFLPSHGAGIISLIVLAVTIYARHSRRLKGAWGKVYAAGAVLAFYLNVFVAVVQAFLKISALHELAPTQSETPFKLTQLIVLVLFIVLGTTAVIRSHDNPSPAR